MHTRFSTFTQSRSACTRLAATCAGALALSTAQAHDGHGLAGTHWHATDTLLWLGALAVVGLAWAWHRGGRK